MVVDRSNVDHIMRGLQSTEGVRLHNHRKKLRQRFDIIKKLGQGTYGKVQLGINKETGQEVAIKTIKKCKIETEADLVRIRREIQIMSSVRHPNIIHIYEVFENREKIVLVMEYAAGGELYDYLSERKVLEETEARRIFRQISTAIYYCHKHKICHRDLKLENILLDEHGSAKIADFGLSNVFDGQRLLSTYCGSPLYASPEIVKGTPYHGPEVDCWSLGVLLYTLVYGAMPFDGSNFKRLVKQISQGDYFEPKKASSASPLIRDMLTVNSPDRATIEQICSHWWVNQGFNVSCLDIAEDLANQTPVRLDLLLSLAPPPENTEKIVVTDDQNAVPQEAPPRSMSVGSFMELDQNAEERVRSFVAREVPSDNVSNEKAMKRKLEPAPSKSFSGARKKERTKPETEEKEEESAVAETEPSAKTVDSNNAVMEVDTEVNKSAEKVKKEEKSEAKLEEKPVETPVSENEKPEKPEAHKMEETKAADAVSKDKPTRKSVKVVKKKVVEKKDAESEKKEGTETPDAKAHLKKKKTESPPREEKPKKEEKEEKTEEKEAGREIKRDGVTRKSRGSVKQAERAEKEEKEKTPRPEEGPSKPVERRKSKIFETAEKFMTSDQKSPTQEKPKKVYIPGVKVSDFAKAFERRSSVPSTPPLKSSPSRKTIIKDTGTVEKKPEERKSPEKKTSAAEAKKEVNSSQLKKTSPAKEQPEDRTAKKKEESPKVETKEKTPEAKEEEEERKVTPVNDEKLKKLKDSARNIIANALVEDERKKLKKQILKPPVPRTKTEDLDSRKKSLTLQIGNETATVQVHTPENTKFLFDNEGETPAGENKENIERPKEKKTAKVEITLKSNTLPRRTSKAELRLASPQVKKEVENFRTEVEHRVGDPSHVYSTQRSEVAFPVSAAQKPIRSMSLEPESRPRAWQSRERIIPIQVEGGHKDDEARDRVKELDRPHEGRQKLPYQRTWSLRCRRTLNNHRCSKDKHSPVENITFRSNSLSRQSTQDSDTESTMSTTGEPIKKSPREFIIPIAVEGGGYVTPRATSLEPSESMSSKRSHRPFSRKFSLFSDNGSEDESPFSTLRDEPFRLHRLRSSRPTRTSVEKADSASGSEEEEDDDGFELLTAENLFSTLLSRVRSLTQRLNVEDGLRPGFPSSRLLSNHFGPSERLFSNFHQPLTRLPERSEFVRSLSRDMENGSNRWSSGNSGNSGNGGNSGGSGSRGDVRNSESNRSVPRGNSKARRSDSDTESVSEGSAASSVSWRREGGRRGRGGGRGGGGGGGGGGGEGEEVTEYVPTFDGNRSLYVAGRKWAGRRSEGEIVSSPPPTTLRSGIPRLLRPRSLYLEKVRGESVGREGVTGERGKEREEGEEGKEKDFYDILAEKYGITNVIRYDLPRESRTRYLTDNLAENRRSLGDSEKKEESEDKSKKETSSAVSSPTTPNSKEGGVVPGEKFKTPSEKLAMVLNRLEGSRKDKKGTTAAAAGDSSCGLSAVAVEPCEKSLSECKKVKDSGEESGKSKMAKKVSRRNLSDMSIEKYTEEQSKKENGTPERSVLSKYLRQSNVETGNKGKEEKRTEEQKEKKKRGESKNGKSKFLTSLERKLERLRTNSERKYVDKAIRSLRESSLGPKDVSSENVLIKRAVSLSDCPSYKNQNAGKIQSTVNSVLGMFKKLENSDKKKEKTEQAPKETGTEMKSGEKSKIPVLKKVDSQPKPSPRSVEPLVLTNYSRRPSFFTGNGFPSHRPCSPALDDSPSYLSPDGDSFDSWSNCSEAANLDDFLHGRTHARMLDDVTKESVSDRIRRKSFYSRFNERKKPRRSSILTNYCPEGTGGEGEREKLSYARSFSGNPTEVRQRPSYCRSVSSGDEGRPRPFHRSDAGESPTRRKTSFDWCRPTNVSSYLRTPAQPPSPSPSPSPLPSPYSSLTLPRNFSTFSGHRTNSFYGPRSPEAREEETRFPSTRPYSSRPVSPSPSSFPSSFPFPFPSSHSPNTFD